MPSFKGTFAEKEGDVEILVGTRFGWPPVAAYRNGAEVHGRLKLKTVGEALAGTFLVLLMAVCIGLPLALIGLCITLLGLTQLGLAKLSRRLGR